MKKLSNKKGFTLIELLAVILILGIIALIAIPTVNNIINDSKKGTFKSTVQNVVKAAEQKCELERLKGSNHTSLYNFLIDDVSEKLELSGKIPTQGLMHVDEECNVKFTNISNDSYKAKKDDKGILEIRENGKRKGKLSEDLQQWDVVYINPETASVCNDYVEENTVSGVTSGCLKWQIYKVNGDGTYQLILDHPINSYDEQIPSWNLNGKVMDGMNEVAISLINKTISWSGDLDARLITADEVAEAVVHPTFNGETTLYGGGFTFPSTTAFSEIYGFTWTSTPVYGSLYGVWLLGISRNEEEITTTLFWRRTNQYGAIIPVITF